MATKTSAKPATKEAKPAAQVKQPATGVGIKELAADLGRKPTSVRAAIRRINGGPVVGQGGRYSWPSRNDKGYRETLKQLQSKPAAEESE